MIDKKIFVIGSGRCGITWIGRWLRQHPETFGGPETHIFTILQHLLNPEWNQGILSWVEEDVVIQNLRQCVTNVFEQCRFRKPNQESLVEHSWIHYKSKSFIKQIFPDAKFVHIYRDGRNVVESKLRAGGTPEEHINVWLDAVKDVTVPRENTFVIKYEDLIADPSKSRQITDFLGLKHHNDIDSWEFPVNTPHFSYDPDRWKTLSKDIQNHMQQTMLQTLQTLGYE